MPSMRILLMGLVTDVLYGTATCTGTLLRLAACLDVPVDIIEPCGFHMLPAISIPKGRDKNGMPIGIQIMNKAFGEENLLRFSKEIEEM